MNPFRAWDLYFPPNEFSNGSAACRFLFSLITLLRDHPELLASDPESIRERGWAELNYEKLGSFRDAGSFADDLTNLFKDDPTKLLQLLSLGVCEVVHEGQSSPITHIQARLHFTSQPAVPYRALKAALIGRFVRVRGNVVRVGPGRPKLSQSVFFCQKCLGRFSVRSPDGQYRVPGKCQVGGCGGGAKCLLLDRLDPDTKCVPWQQIRIQESHDDDDAAEEAGDEDWMLSSSNGNKEGGRVPRTIEVELEATLVDAVAPGDTIELGAIVKAADLSDGKVHTQPTYSVYLEANWIKRDREHQTEISDDHVVHRISSIPTKQILPLLVGSFCPQIYGHSLVKLGILLTLFGGSNNNSEGTASSKLSVRSDPHLLLIGDPGLGKSQLITWAANIAPRGIYVCGNTCTASGLTATLHHDGSASGGSGGYTLEAGALVLADTGVCCIDEFDKCREQHRVLLQVMEQQVVAVAKAGVVCTLPARTSVIAAANPVGGHFNRGKGLLANLKIEPALLSRFDLVFVLLDKPDSHLDRMLSAQVLGTFSASSLTNGKRISTFAEPAPPVTPGGLLGRITEGTQDGLQHLSAGELRKLIAYARANVQPRMTQEAGALLQSFYLNLRQKDRSTSADADLLPITTRHLEALIRLAQARAKLELRPVVEVQDAVDVIELVQYCLFEFLQKEEDATILPEGKRTKAGQSRSALLKRYVTELIRISASTGTAMFTEQQLRELYAGLQILAVPFQELLEALNQYGYIIRKAPGQYKLCVT